jgi:hypothetical protein
MALDTGMDIEKGVGLMGNMYGDLWRLVGTLSELSTAAISQAPISRLHDPTRRHSFLLLPSPRFTSLFALYNGHETQCA